MHTLPMSVSLRAAYDRLGLAPWSQGKRGTCSVFAVTAALEFARGKQAGEVIPLSQEFLNWASNRAINEYADGGFFHDLWTGFAAYGICSDGLLPYRAEFDPDLSPSDEARADAALAKAWGLELTWIKPWDVMMGIQEPAFQQVLAAIAGGWPVLCGLRWPKTPAWTGDLLGMCGADDVFDGHSIVFVGYESDDTALVSGSVEFRDSRSPGGYWRMPFDYVRAYANDAAVIR